MKKIFIGILFIITAQMNGQNGYKHFLFKGGSVLNRGGGVNMSLGIDFAGEYYTSIEISVSYFKKNDEKRFENYLFGINYKPLLFREKNSIVKLRMGVYTGSVTDDFTLAPNIGIEYLYSISNNVDFFINNDNSYYFFSTQRWISIANIGFRVAL